MAEEVFSDNLAPGNRFRHLFLVRDDGRARDVREELFRSRVAEKALLDQTVMGMIASNYQAVMTPDGLRGQATQQPVGFRAHEGQKS